MGLKVRSPDGWAAVRDRFAIAARGGFVKEVERAVGQAMLKQLNDEYRESRDPYGQPWAPVERRRRRDRRGSAKPLLDTGRMRASAFADAGAAGVRIVIPTSYAIFHQTGTRKMVRRQLVPSASRGVAPKWRDAIREAADKVIRKRLRLR